LSYEGRRDTLRFRLSAYIALAILVTGAVAGGVFIHLLKREKEAVIAEHLRWMATGLAYLVEDEFLESEIEEVGEVLQIFEQTEMSVYEGEPFENLEYLEVLDADGEVLGTAQAGVDDDERAFMIGLRPEVTAAKEEYFWERKFDEDCTLLGFVYPVNSGGVRIGTVHVALCDRPIRHLVGEYTKLGGLFLLAAGFLGLVFGGRLATWVTRPIRRLAEGAGELSGGRFGCRTEVTGPAEIRSLAESFNSMAINLEQKVAELVDAREEAVSLSDKLSDSYERMKKTAGRLEDANRESTELANKLEGLNRELAAEKKQTETIVHSIKDGIIAIDVEEKVILMNPEAEELFGVSEEEAVGRPVGIFVDKLLKKVEDPNAFHDAFLKSVAEPGRESDLTFRVTSPEMKAYKRRSSAIRDENGDLSGRVVTFTDITREQEIDSMKTNFVSTVSHELRTPLTSIKGALALLMDGRVGDDRARKEFLQIAEYNTDRLISLITNLLDISRMDAGVVSLNISRIDIVGLVSEFVSKTPFMTGRDDVRLELSCPEETVQVLGDREKLEQVLSNLLSNAYKFSPAGGTVRLNVSADREDVLIAVEDDGPGVPPDKADRVFDRFYQVDMSATRRFGGTGLGLSICKAIVEEHGGIVHLESPLNNRGGTRFVVRLPRARQVQMELGLGGGETKARDPEGGQGIVLVADADEDVIKVHRQALEAEGYKVIEATNGRDALRMVREQMPGLVFMDVDLPEMQGYDVAEAMKSDEATNGIPIVFTSEEGKDVRAEEVVKRCGYIPKPFREGMLVEKVRQCLGKG